MTTDCPAICGNGVIDTGERCDRGITAGFPGACAYTCDDADACTVDLTRGSVEGCSRDCLHHRVDRLPERATAAARPAARADTDRDCDHACGDGMVGARETCDPTLDLPHQLPRRRRSRARASSSPATPPTCNVACRHVPVTDLLRQLRRSLLPHRLHERN